MAGNRQQVGDGGLWIQRQEYGYNDTGIEQYHQPPTFVNLPSLDSDVVL